MIRTLLILSFLFIHVLSHAQEKSLVNWRTWDEVSNMSAADKTGKKYLVDLYTSWCGWCKRMDKTTFNDPEVAKYINERFIAIKFDAESKEDIVFNNQIYKYQKMGARGYNELAMALTNSSMRFPTVVFLDESGAIIQAIPGYQDPLSLNQIMHYFSDNFHHTMHWNVFVKNYKQILDNEALIDDTPPGNSRLVGNPKN